MKNVLSTEVLKFDVDPELFFQELRSILPANGGYSWMDLDITGTGFSSIMPLDTPGIVDEMERGFRKLKMGDSVSLLTPVDLRAELSVRLMQVLKNFFNPIDENK